MTGMVFLKTPDFTPIWGYQPWSRKWDHNPTKLYVPLLLFVGPMSHFQNDLSFYEILGLAGAALYLLSYVLTALDKLPSNAPGYYVAKLLASALVAISLLEQFNLASAIIQSFFFLVSLLGIVRHLHLRNRKTKRSTGVQDLPLPPFPPLSHQVRIHDHLPR